MWGCCVSWRMRDAGKPGTEGRERDNGVEQSAVSCSGARKLQAGGYRGGKGCTQDGGISRHRALELIDGTWALIDGAWALR